MTRVKLDTVCLKAEVISSRPDANWLCLSLVSFEVVHDLSRILRMIPDKMAVALAINRAGGEDVVAAATDVDTIRIKLKSLTDRIEPFRVDVFAPTLVVQLTGSNILKLFLTINDNSVDGDFGSRTLGGRKESADQSTELWRHP